MAVTDLDGKCNDKKQPMHRRFSRLIRDCSYEI